MKDLWIHVGSSVTAFGQDFSAGQIPMACLWPVSTSWQREHIEKITPQKNKLLNQQLATSFWTLIKRLNFWAFQSISWCSTGCCGIKENNQDCCISRSEWLKDLKTGRAEFRRQTSNLIGSPPLQVYHYNCNLPEWLKVLLLYLAEYMKYYSHGISVWGYLFFPSPPTIAAAPHGAPLVPQSTGTIKVFIDPEKKKTCGTETFWTC